MKRFQITVNGTAYDVTVQQVDEQAPVAAPAPITKASSSPAAGTVPVKAPMPGIILDIKAAVGSSVKAGEVLIVLEAMKMENEIVAPQDGTIAAICCTKGSNVNVDDVLLELC